MIFSAFQREDDDALFTVVRNVSGGALAAGDSVSWDTASPDGVRVTAPAANTLSLFRGVVAEAIADSQYGKVQVGGYNSYAKVTNTTNVAIAAGDVLLTSTGKVLARAADGTGGVSGFVYAAEAVATATTPAAAAKKVFIRAL